MFFRLLILSLLCILCSASDDFSSFRPDLSTSDPYLPYLRRLPLSGVWDGAVCFSKNTDEIRVRVEMLSNYECINSNWLESQEGYRYKESYFGDMIDALNLNPSKVKKMLV